MANDFATLTITLSNYFMRNEGPHPREAVAAVMERIRTEGISAALSKPFDEAYGAYQGLNNATNLMYLGSFVNTWKGLALAVVLTKYVCFLFENTSIPSRSYGTLIHGVNAELLKAFTQHWRREDRHPIVYSGLSVLSHREGYGMNIQQNPVTERFVRFVNYKARNLGVQLVWTDRLELHVEELPPMAPGLSVAKATLLPEIMDVLPDAARALASLSRFPKINDQELPEHFSLEA